MRHIQLSLKRLKSFNENKTIVNKLHVTCGIDIYKYIEGPKYMNTAKCLYRSHEMVQGI